MSLAAFQALFYQVSTQPQTLVDEALQGYDPALAAMFKRVPSARLDQYRWMVYANHADTLETIYPLSACLLADSWESCVRDYLRAFPPSHYQLYETARAFPEFLSDYKDYSHRYPFSNALAAYELLEAEILRKPDVPDEKSASLNTDSTLPDEDSFYTLAPVINMAASAFEGTYPLDDIVNLLKQGRLDLDALEGIQPAPFLMWAYRDTEHCCRFLKVTPFIQAFLRACLAQDSGQLLSYSDHWQKLIAHFELPDTQEMRQGFLGIFPQLMTLGVLKGSLRLTSY